MNDNVQHDEISSSTGVPLPPYEMALPREPCSRDISYRERLTKTLDIIYTDLFLDVSNYERDKTIFIERVLGERFTPPSNAADADVAANPIAANTAAAASVAVVVVCSANLYNYIAGAERERGRRADTDGFCVIRTGGGVDVYFCDVTMTQAPERVDMLVTFNVDPFDVSSREGNRHFPDDTSRLKRTFKHVMSADYKNERKTQSGPITTRLVFSVFSLNERALESFSASNNVTVTVTDVRFVLIDDNTDTNAALDFVCNYCSDTMLCLNNDMTPFVVDGEMPFSVDFELISDPLNFIKLNTRTDLLKTAPEDEYFRFKQFYHTFVYGKRNKWGVEVVRDDADNGAVDGTDDKARCDRTSYIDLLNDAMRAELTRLYKILRKVADHNAHERVKRSGRYEDASVARYRPNEHLKADEVETEEMLKARDKLFKAYSACPLLMNGVDVRSITAFGYDEDGASLLKRDHRRLVASAIADGKRPRGPGRPQVDKNIYAIPIVSPERMYDTTTYPHGGDLCDINILNALLAREVAFSSCMVIQNRLAEPSNSRIRYNRFLNDILFSRQGI